MTHISLQQPPQSIFRVLVNGYKLYKTGFPKVWYWQLLFMFPFIMLSLVSSFIATKMPFLLNTQKTGYWVFLVVSLSSTAAALWLIFGQCFIFSLLRSIGMQNKATPGEFMRLATRKMLPAFAGSVLILMIAIAFLSIGVIVANVLLHLSATYLIASTFETLAFAIAIYWVTTQVFFLPFLLFENCSLGKAILSSYRLTWGKWWRLLVTLFLAVLSMPLALLVLGLINAGLALIFPGLSIYLPWVGLAESMLFNSLFAPFFSAVLIVLFYDLKARNK